MRIGIDLDDTICRTSEIVHDRLDRYATKEKRKDEKYQISAKDLLSTDNVMSEEQYKHSIK